MPAARRAAVAAATLATLSVAAGPAASAATVTSPVKDLITAAQFPGYRVELAPSAVEQRTQTDDTVSCLVPAPKASRAAATALSRSTTSGKITRVITIGEQVVRSASWQDGHRYSALARAVLATCVVGDGSLRVRTTTAAAPEVGGLAGADEAFVVRTTITGAQVKGSVTSTQYVVRSGRDLLLVSVSQASSTKAGTKVTTTVAETPATRKLAVRAVAAGLARLR